MTYYYITLNFIPISVRANCDPEACCGVVFIHALRCCPLFAYIGCASIYVGAYKPVSTKSRRRVGGVLNVV